MQWPLCLCRRSAYGQWGTIFLDFYIWRPDFECSQLRLIFECTIQDLGLLQKKENSNVKHESWKHLHNDLDTKHKRLVIEQNFYIFSKKSCSSSLHYMQGHFSQDKETNNPSKTLLNNTLYYSKCCTNSRVSTFIWYKKTPIFFFFVIENQIVSTILRRLRFANTYLLCCWLMQCRCKLVLLLQFPKSLSINLLASS